MFRSTAMRSALLPLFYLVIAACATDSFADDSLRPARPDHDIGEEPMGQTRYPRLIDDPEHAGRIAAIPAASPPRPRTDPEIEALLESLTLRQRIGQRFIAMVRGNRVAYGAGRAILEVAPAGFIIYPWNFQSAADVQRLTSSLQFVASQVTPAISLLISADQEGGRVATFRFPEFVRFPSAAAMAGFDDPSLIRSAAHITAQQLRTLGVNMNLAPVLDLHPVADNSIIGDRSYGGDPIAVSRFVRPYLDAFRESRVIATAKHFPGHGVTTIDSHYHLPVVSMTREELMERDLLPFRTAIAAGVPAIMTGHVLFERIDPFYPATISSVFMHDILRHELGYEGVVITDGLEMYALSKHYSLPETLVRLFKYDVDLILLYREYDVVDLVTMVEELIDAGDLTQDDVNRGVRRVLALKRSYGLINREIH